MSATHEVRLDLPSGSLGAVVDEPVGSTGRGPVVLLLAGSGPTDHDGDNPLLPTPVGNLRQIGAALGARRIATIRPAKRGIGLSAAGAPPEAEMTIDRLVDDAVAWIEWARAQDRWSKVVVAGHSEGALIGAAAATRTTVDGYVSLAGTADRAADVLRVQLRRQLPVDLMADADRVLRALEQGATGVDAPPALAALFRPSVQPYLVSWFALDPCSLVASLACPALFVHGTDDAQIPADHADRLASARPANRDTEVVVLDHVDHLLLTTGTATVDPRVTAALATFVAA